jgi:hypothetical protein
MVGKLIEEAKEHERRVLDPFGLERSQELKATLLQMIALHKGGGEEPPEEDE